MTSISRPKLDWSTLENPFSNIYNSIFFWSLWFLAFAPGQIFQLFARPGNVDNYGLNTPPKPMEGPSWLKMTLLKIWSLGWSVLGRSCFGLKYFQAEVGIGLKYYWEEVFLGSNCASGRSMFGAKVSVGPKWSWGHTVCEPVNCLQLNH